jgi:CheY-like chemotaxis protein
VSAILVVDDDPVSLMLVESVLQAEGYETRKATSPVHALEILKSWTPDVILVDIELHGLENGLEFARRLKANVATRATTIVAFTAYRESWSEEEARLAGCDGFLEKPITAQKLAAALREQLEKPQ